MSVTGTTNLCPCCSGTHPGHMGYDPAYLDVHSCSHECKRPLCVAQRTIEALESDLAALEGENESLRREKRECESCNVAQDQDERIASLESDLAACRRDAENWRALLAHTDDKETVDLTGVPDWHDGWVFIHDQESMTELAALSAWIATLEGGSPPRDTAGKDKV